MADSQGIIAPKSLANTPSVGTATTALAVNTARAGWAIQNQGTATLYVLLGSGASSSVFHFSLKAATGNDDGTGGLASQTAGTVYTGLITVAGAPLRYTVLEM